MQPDTPLREGGSNDQFASGQAWASSPHEVGRSPRMARRIRVLHVGCDQPINV